MWQNHLLFLAALLALVLVPFSDGAQSQERVFRVGYLAVRSGEIPDEVRAGLRDLGYVEGRNFTFEVRTASSDSDRLTAAAAELVAAKVDVILTPNGRAGLAAKRLTKTVPIVVYSAADPIAQGLVESLSRPGGNVTGLTIISPDVVAKSLQLITQAFPHVTRIAALHCPDSSVGEKQWRETQLAVEKLKLGLIPAGVRSAAEVEEVLMNAEAKGAEATLFLDCSRACHVRWPCCVFLDVVAGRHAHTFVFWLPLPA
jgi:putative ABC transport system substrate-binding protein